MRLVRCSSSLHHRRGVLGRGRASAESSAPGWRRRRENESTLLAVRKQPAGNLGQSLSQLAMGMAFDAKQRVVR